MYIMNPDVLARCGKKLKISVDEKLNQKKSSLTRILDISIYVAHELFKAYEILDEYGAYTNTDDT